MNTHLCNLTRFASSKLGCFEAANLVRLQIYLRCFKNSLAQMTHEVRWFVELHNVLNFKNRVANAEIGISYLAV